MKLLLFLLLLATLVLSGSSLAQLPPFPRAGSEYAFARALEHSGTVLAVDYVKLFAGEAGCTQGIKEGYFKTRKDCDFLELDGVGFGNKNTGLRRFPMTNAVKYKILGQTQGKDWTLRPVTAAQFKLLLGGQNAALEKQVGLLYATLPMPDTLLELRFSGGKLYEIQQVYMP